jgi:rSAM/selenodomain-associated transferase 1
MSAEATICVFAKPPVPGEVKTRLAASLGMDCAARLARAFLDDTLDAVRALPWAQAALASTAEVEADVPVLLQGEGDLGVRIERVLRAALQRTPLAMAIGADAPALPARLLESARKALQEVDVAIGPAEDGGFYLLALRHCPAGLLQGVSWSSGDTLHSTLKRLGVLGLRTKVLEPWFDVDRPEDLHRLRTMIAERALVAPRTERVLSSVPR